MEQIKLSELNDQELIQKLKKLKTNKIVNATLIGLLLGVSAYSAVKNGFSFFTFFPLFFVLFLLNSGKKNSVFEKELKNEMDNRNSK